MITDLGRGVFTFDHEPAEGKDVLVVTRRGAVVIDTGNEPTDGRVIVDFINRRHLELAFVVLTHGHGDHIFGWPVFTGSDVLATRSCRSVIARQYDLFERRFGRRPDAGDLPEPTFEFDRSLVIDCGDCSLELIATPGHSPDSLCVHIPQRKTLVCGDTVVTAIPVAINEGDGRQLEDSTSQLLDYESELLIAGHGSPVEGQTAVREWLTFQRDYLQELRRRVQRVIGEHTGGDDLERRCVEACDFDALLGSRLPRGRYKMETRHHNVIRKIIREET